jgi:hypothetical protein
VKSVFNAPVPAYWFEQASALSAQAESKIKLCTVHVALQGKIYTSIAVSQLIHIGTTTYRSCKCIQNLNSLALSRLSPKYQNPTRQNMRIKVQWDFEQEKILHHWIMARSFEHKVQVIQIFIKKIYLR